MKFSYLKPFLLALSLMLILNACSSKNENGETIVNIDTVSTSWSNSFRAYRNNTSVVDKFADLRIYQVMVESFLNGDDSINYDTGYGPSDHKGDLKGVIKAIPYIKSLGMNAIWLTPIFESAKIDEKPSMLDATGYYTRNYYKVDRRFGDENVLKELVETAHKNGLYVFLDGVFGHFRDDLENTSPNHNQVTITKKCIGSNLQPYTPPVNTSCANFDDNGKSLDYMIEVATYYVTNYKIDGWRLDQAYQVPLDGLRKIKKAVEIASKNVTYQDGSGATVHPLAYIVAEIWSDNRTIASRAYGNTDNPALDSAFDFGMRYPIVQTFAVEEWMKKDHSGTRLLEGLKYNENNLPKHALPNLMITNHDLVRFGDLIQRAGENDTYYQRIKLALSYLAIAHSGPITNYYGEEIAQNVPGFDKRVNKMGYYDDHVARDNGKIDNFTKDENQIKELFTYLMKLRSEHGSLSNGRMDLLKVTRSIFSCKKSFKGDDDFYYFINLSNEPMQITISKDVLNGDDNLVALINNQCKLATKNQDGSISFSLAPLSFELLQNKSSKEVRCFR